jgi:nicotinate phosphoribosyltransferase
MRRSNSYVGPLLTDLYEFTMAYAYFCSEKHEDPAVFEMFFRRNPFHGEFTILAGISEVQDFLAEYRFGKKEIDVLCSVIPHCGEAFRSWLATVDCSRVRVYAPLEGTTVFPRIPLLRVEGPLAVCQMMESALTNLISYPSLVATNAAQMRLAAGGEGRFIEFGLRRAQGPDGAVSASRYSYLGGFDGTSNVLASSLFDIPATGTQAHAYISAFTSLSDVRDRSIKGTGNKDVDFVGVVLKYRKQLGFDHTNEGELASFIGYAQAFPRGFLALVDTYDTLHSGIPNFLAVALALKEVGYDPVGIRLDSGDLAHLSKEARAMFKDTAARFNVDFSDLKIVASNEINELTLRSLRLQGHEIDIFGIGTHLVTCQAQPSLGCVYKLVEINGKPRMKISQDAGKTTIPGRKEAYRLMGKNGRPLLDLLLQVGEKAPKRGKRVLCCHPFEAAKRTYVTPSQVIPLHHCIWDGKAATEKLSLREAREHVAEQLNMMREDHLRLVNPTPYKVSVTERLFDFMHKLWNREARIGELH